MNFDYEIKKYSRDMHPESHIHESYEIFISLSNEGNFFVGEQAYLLSVGTIFFLNPFEIHHCFCRGSQEYDRYVIHYTQEHLQALSTEQTNMVALFESAPVVQQLPDDLLAELLGQLAALMKPAKERFGADVERNINFDRASGNGYSNPPAERGTRVTDILSYIHKHYAEEITLDDLAGQFFISKSRLSQIFKNTTGFSIGNYIIVYRIKRACALLSAGESVQNVGRMVGFRNNTHFIRMFKKHIGCPPGRFSRREKEEK